MSSRQASLLALLKERFGHDRFRPLQEEIIANVLGGGDSLVLMPTGGGKSLCYQLPALAFPGVTLVVSPLIALMKDQVDALNAKGVAADFINSALSSREIEGVQARTRQGNVKLLYAAPERIAMPGFVRFLQSLNLSLIAIDEAHCISEWGHEFRPDYRNLRQLREEFPAIPVIALTATATERVRQDIIDQLRLRQGRVFASSFNRDNLVYSAIPKRESWEQLTALLRQCDGQSAIVYCFSRQETEDLSARLNAGGFQALPYHAGLEPHVRRRAQEAFLSGDTPIIVATIAFGMGIDKPDIRLVAHYSMPKSIEGYYQETGRAGRDGAPSKCVLFYSYSDKRRQDYFIDQIEDATEQQNARRRLARMMEYARLPVCRRRALLAYFGEQWPHDNCGACDVCLDSREEYDATEIAQKILSAVARTGGRFGARYIFQVLTGSKEEALLERGHDSLSVYGIARGVRREEILEIVGHLVARGLLARTNDKYETLSLAPEGWEFLKERQPLTLPRPALAPYRRESRSRRATSDNAAYDQGLFDKLRALRRRLADAEGVPPFVVFSDAALRQMAAAVPRSPEEFLQVPGVGPTKLERYGAQFVEAICGHAGKSAPPAAPEPSQPAEERRDGIAPGVHTRQALGGTYYETETLLRQRLPIAEIARRRERSEGTIIGQLERLADAGEPLELAHLLPGGDALREIEQAFALCGSAFVRPVWEYFEGRIDYGVLRLARVHLRQQGKLPEG